MQTCAECIHSMLPYDDPRVRAGRYHLCGCDYCNKPETEREFEQLQADVESLKKTYPEIVDIPEVKQLKYQVEQAKAGYLHLQNKLNEHLDKSKQQSQSAF